MQNQTPEQKPAPTKPDEVVLQELVVTGVITPLKMPVMDFTEEQEKPLPNFTVNWDPNAPVIKLPKVDFMGPSSRPTPNFDPTEGDARFKVGGKIQFEDKKLRFTLVGQAGEDQPAVQQMEDARKRARNPIGR